MAATDKRKIGSYTLGRALVRGDRGGRAPAIHEAHDGGVFLFAKTWSRTGSGSDLQALWNHEIRSLLRIGSYPRAADYFVRIRDLGADDSRHWIMIDAGDRKLLSQLLAERTKHVWIRDLNAAQNRRRMWDGVRRVATGLGILHGEGTLHRSLDANCVFCDQDGSYDLRLGGFEWSLRISAMQARPDADRPNRIAAPELAKGAKARSFATDWFDLGVLVTEILGLNVTGRGHRALAGLIEAIENVPYFTSVEKDVMRRLLAADPELRLSRSSDVLQALSEAGSSVRNRSIFAQKPLYVGFQLGPGSKLTEAICDISRASGRRIDPENREEQLAFIQRDIVGDVQILIRRSPSEHYVIDGRRLQYRVQKWSKRQETWDVGHCATTAFQRFDPRETIARLDGRKIELRLAPRVLDNLLKVRQMAADWTAVFPFEDRLELLDDGQQFTLDFFRLTNQLDALLTAARIWPVTVTRLRAEDRRVLMEVTPASDPQRELLAQNLGLSSPAEQMRTLFCDEESSLRFASDVEFSFSVEGILGRNEQESTVRWRFKDAREHPKGWRYTFWHEEPEAAAPEQDETLFLMPREIAGSVAQLKRRHRAIESMRSHAGLLRLLERPEDARQDVGDDRSSSGDDPSKPPRFAGLDGSKRDALSAILSTQPIYALQGPPGTGKTHLLDAMVTDLLKEDRSAQVLVSAQSHEAVDIVKRKLVKHLDEPGTERPVLVRLDRDKDPFHATHVAQAHAVALAASPLTGMAPPHIAKRIAAAADPSRKADAAFDARSFETLVKGAANVVFATSNSGELEKMLEDSQRFDWSIVEEAGKAHGFDLTLAVQASHRLLLIGDQEQLPPFNFEALENLLADPARIKTALTNGGRFAPGLIERSIVEDTDDFRAKCAEWRGMVHFFAEVYRRCADSERNGIPLASRLDTQHRMHPHIAELVSNCFYGGGLGTDDEKATEFLDGDAPFVADGWLEPERILFVDLPWVQAVKDATGERGGLDGHRRYSNPAEADAACKVLAAMRPRSGTRCEIQLLTPYHAQRRHLAERIREGIADGSLAHLEGPEFEMSETQLGMTVDSFQGGEADVVVASLVRNNDSPRGRGLGIMAQSQRMNVLLSRARHKLVVVGSWAFLESRLDPQVKPEVEDPLFHLHRFLEEFRRLEAEGKARRIKLDVKGNRT